MRRMNISESTVDVTGSAARRRDQQLAAGGSRRSVLNIKTRRSDVE
jgi:hypothetical protein